jgi:predicted aspartyl protease
MQPIIIGFRPSGLGRVEFSADVLTGDMKTLGSVLFKLDSGSDFTTISCKDLEELGYPQEFLQNCPVYGSDASTATEELRLQLRYIAGVSIKFGDRELQGCRIYFALGTELRSLFGSDIMKYFNWEVNYDENKLRLTQRTALPQMAADEKPIQIYTLAES